LVTFTSLESLSSHLKSLSSCLITEMIRRANGNDQEGLDNVFFPNIIHWAIHKCKIIYACVVYSQLSFHCGDCLKDWISSVIWKMRC